MEDITFSLFKGYADTLPAEATLSEIIRMIRQDPTVKLHTLKHRYYASQGNAAAADKEKSSCPCFSVAVRFQGGKRKRHICGWTSVGLVDIDHLEKAALPELLKRIVADPHTLLTYTTISGAGIRILYRMEHDENTLQRAVASPLDEGKLPILGYPLLDGRQSAPV
ncbi:BT4734/BF3469 family protein [Phocaeicola coprophilus]|uniref:BT4734/BF3469 family protein n=1 Tax=Phocaeicola coprophilus TaxID=387090 RepID=UPI00266F1ADC|nr:BT4734/BF3469 family protein [Phocaeicola coprophilus]